MTKNILPVTRIAYAIEVVMMWLEADANMNSSQLWPDHLWLGKF